MNVLIYSRPKVQEPIAEQTVNSLAEQLHQVGIHVDISHSLNIPRLILNSYQCVHLVIENLPLTANEAFHLGVSKALGKPCLLSVLNSDPTRKKGLLMNFVKPDALSVSQTNHLKYYRDYACNKFVLSAFPKTEVSTSKGAFKHQGYLIPLQEKLEEAFDYKFDSLVFFDGRKLLAANSSSQLRKKWSDFIGDNKLNGRFHLILSDTKVSSILAEQSVAVVLADPSLSHTEFIRWLGETMNKSNVILLNEFQATGFSNYWTSGRNCVVLPADNWKNSLNAVELKPGISRSCYKSSDLFESTVNDLSRLYSKLSHQKTSLLTSGSVKL